MVGFLISETSVDDMDSIIIEKFNEFYHLKVLLSSNNVVFILDICKCSKSGKSK